MNITKHKGDIGLTKVIAALTEQGIAVSIPISEHLKYDLVAEKSGNLKRIQVKYTTSNQDKIEIKLNSSWANSKGNHELRRQKGDYDVLAVYYPTNNKCYFINSDEFDCVRAITLRLNEPKKKNQGVIRYAKDYEDCNKMWGVGVTGSAVDC